MNDATFRRALKTTAKIALSLTVFACGGTVDVADQSSASTDDPPEPERPVYDEEEEEPPVQVYRPEEEEEETLACEAAPVGEEVAILDTEQLDCCVALLEPAWPGEGPEAWQEWETTMKDEAVGACCNIVVAHANESFQLVESLGWQNVQMCCQAAGSPFGPACTPWGPPVPPAMGAFADLDELEIA